MDVEADILEDFPGAVVGHEISHLDNHVSGFTVYCLTRHRSRSYSIA